MKILTSDLVKIALRVTWDPAPTVGLAYELRKEYPCLSEKQISKLIGRILSSGFINQVWTDRYPKNDVNAHERVGKYALARGIAKELL